MKPLLLSLYLFFVGTYTICAQTELPKIYLNPKSNAVISQSQFVDSISFIPLEEKKGIRTPSSVSGFLSQDLVVINDYFARKLYMYSKDGSFLDLIDYGKLSKNPGTRYDDYKKQLFFIGTNKRYELTEKDMLQLKKNWDNPRTRKYFTKHYIDLNDPSFTLQKDKITASDMSKNIALYEGLYWKSDIMAGSSQQDSVDYELKIYKGDQLIKQYFPYKAKNEPRFLFAQESVNLLPTESSSTRILTRPFCDTIYKMTKDSIIPLYQLVLPLENALSPSFFTTPFKNETQRDNYERNNGWAFSQVQKFQETNSIIFLTLEYLNNQQSYIYHKETRNTYKVQNIKPDEKQFGLTLLSNYPSIFSGNRLFQNVPASKLIDFFKTHSSIPVPPELDAFLKNKPSDNAPVIVEYKLKN